ncbi:MAG: type II secretion system F family protein [Candidatus Aenigmarchaeota archaeon]|nr:type II secretion system F family protein [Candidatus Aenigmarchaeota archaeon]
MHRLYKRLAVTAFGRIAEAKGFQKLKPSLEAAGIHILAKTYASMVLLSTVLVFVATLTGMATTFGILGLTDLPFLLMLATFPVFAALMAFVLLYYYPAQRAKAFRKSLEIDLPFALAHLSAIASSGISPENMFELLTGFKEYRAVSAEASQVVRNIRTFGMSSVTAINEVASSTPSPIFKQVLTGITFTIEKGGNLSEYIKQMADKSLFDYRIKREKYLQTLGTYADIYAALLVAAPLMMLAVLGILAVIGGEILGLTIPDLITTLTFIILPLLNVAFLAFIHLTYPGV